MNWEDLLFKTAAAGLIFSVLASLLAVVLKKTRRGTAGSSPSRFSAVEKASLLLSLLVFMFLTVFLVLRTVRGGLRPFYRQVCVRDRVCLGHFADESIFFPEIWRFLPSIFSALQAAPPF